ncbi:MAG: hypothetical protein Q4G08_04540, partial [Capnocytophaga sp.]|nr:hypothetical protein [Capnocytophaga sp.]
MKNTVLGILFIALSWTITVSAQQRQPTVFANSNTASSAPNSFNNNWTFGGNVGITGGSGGLGVFFTPRVGYLVAPNFEVSANVNYTLQNTNYFRSSIFGVGLALNYYIMRNFYVNSSYQYYFINQKNKNTRLSYSTDEQALYVGGGYMQQLGNGVYMQIGGTYNVLYNKDKSVFSSGFVPNVGVVIGL